MSVGIALFVVALLITIAGLFLSPKSQEQHPRYRDNSPLTGKHTSNTQPILVRRYRMMHPDNNTPQNIPMKLRTHAQPDEIYTSTISAQQAKARTGRVYTGTMSTGTQQILRIANSASQAATPGVGRSAGANMKRSAGVASVKPVKNLRDLLLSWQVGAPGLIMIFLLCLYLLNLTLPHAPLWTSTFFGSTNPPPTPVTGSAPTTYTASEHLIRLGQLDPGQYQSMQEYNTWAYSACSAAAMTEVINSYGHKYHITDILTVESRIHEITPELGLLEDSGIQHTGNQFGFKTTWGHNLSLDQVIATANSGTPVIVDFPPSRFPGGHVLVVRGGDSNFVDLADSSRLNMTQLSRERFLQLWGGFSAIMTPV